MRKPEPLPGVPSAAVAATDTAAPSSSSASAALQFFVRAISPRILVIGASPDDTVGSVIKQVAGIAGIAASEVRLIYSGRQLPVELTLAACSVSADSTLHLNGRLRSTRSPLACRVVDDLVGLTFSLLRTDPPSNHCELRRLRDLVWKFVSLPPRGRDKIQAFLSAQAPMALVKLYLSSDIGYRAMAGAAIRLLLNYNVEFFPIVLELARLLAGTADLSHPLKPIDARHAAEEDAGLDV